MFSFTIAEFTFLCVGFAFVGSLILFPSFRQQLKALAGGFLQVFVQDTAKTPDGARAIYAQKIDEMTEKYTDACNTLRDLTGKLKTIQDNYAVCQKQAKSYDERAKAAMSRGDEESATTYARLLQEELDKAENLSAQFQKMKPAAEEVKTIKEKPTASDKPATNVTTNASTGDDTINLSLDEWAGWLSLVSANNGLTTQPGSVFDQLGIKVNINVINDATESSNALISGDLQAAGYTTNRVAFLSQKFTDAGKNIIMPVFTNYSYGGDGIIASTQFADVNSWVNAKIGVPEFSEAETLVAWFVNNSNLSDADKATIMNNLIMFGTADDTAKAYFAGQIDVAATWEPYLTQAKTYTNSTVVFDTKSSSSLVMDGIVFDADWAAAHEDTVKKFVKGILMSYDQPINYEAAREVFPMYSTSSEADIDATYANAKMASWKDNYNILNDTAPMIYNQMCDIWEALGETVNRGLVDTIFDTTYIDALKGDFKSTSAANATTKVTVSDETRANITQQVTGNLDYDSMLSKTANVTFVPDSSVFTDQASAASVLDDFVNIAKTLDGTMIVINGNINADTQTEFGVQLSANRAQTVANYLASQGIDQNRLIITGSGNAKYQADKAAGALKPDASVYQSTDISFMRIEN